MTDNKPIIIDSIDVSACKFLTTTGHCKAQMSIMGTDANKCKCFPNCNYKQLTRLENQIANLSKMVETKEQECDRLKYDNDYEVGALEKTIDNLKAENEELKNCLAEIKEIANYSFNRPTSAYMAKLELILQKISEAEND